MGDLHFLEDEFEVTELSRFDALFRKEWSRFLVKRVSKSIRKVLNE
ncbi:MAG: hypothetical protein L3J43_01180 [Sulfurovum sp.]|nr:hypothetical protein [Sulfurovum sp.]